MAEKGYNFDKSGTRRIISATRYVESLPRSADQLDYGAPVARHQIWHAKITAKAAINGAIRWKYTIELGQWDMSDSPSTGGTWTPFDNAATLYAFNSAEDMNTFGSGSGAIGTGNTVVTRSDGTVNGGSCKLVPLPVDGYCLVTLRGYDPATEQLYYTIINFANSAQ